MTQREKMLQGLLYDAADPELAKMRMRAKQIVFDLQQLPPTESDKQQQLLKELLGRTGKNFHIEMPFRCDYGENISVGENFYANYNLTILDCASVQIGDNVMIAPNVSIFTAGHPIDADKRNQLLEYAFPITIGNNVWIGGNTVITPNVRIGNNVVIGAGSVVTKDIPDNCVAVGNPCRVLREINQRDKEFYFKDRKFKQ